MPPPRPLRTFIIPSQPVNAFSAAAHYAVADQGGRGDEESAAGMQAYVHYPMRIVKEGGLISALLGKVARFINIV